MKPADVTPVLGCNSDNTDSAQEHLYQSSLTLTEHTKSDADNPHDDGNDDDDSDATFKKTQ